MARYWLSAWLDHHAIETEQDAERALRSPTVRNDLRKIAMKASRRQETPSLANDFSVVAGRGIDLSGQLDCKSDTCRLRQVNNLFGHVWHYFDTIIVDDPVIHEIQFHWDAPTAKLNKWVLSHIRVLLYLRSIGAEDLVDFRVKPPPCTAHWERHAEEAGLKDLVSQADSLAEYLLRDGEITPGNIGEDGDMKVRFDHPLINPAYTAFVEPSYRDSPQLPMMVARQVVRSHVAHLSSDVGASLAFHASLGAVNPIHDLFLRRTRGVRAEDVIMNLKLPVLEGLTPWDLIAIRRDEGQYFSSFRDALVLAAKERIKDKTNAVASEIAEEIRLDVIQPELNKIEARLKAAQNTLSKKSAVGLVLSTLTTGCGLLAGMDPTAAVTAGTGVAVTCAGAATWKYLDERNDVSLSDMFFLWKAVQHVPH